LERVGEDSLPEGSWARVAQTIDADPMFCRWLPSCLTASHLGLLFENACLGEPNAGPQARLEAAAQRRLYAVACTPWLGASAATPPHMWKERGQPARFLLSSRTDRGAS